MHLGRDEMNVVKLTRVSQDMDEIDASNSNKLKPVSEWGERCGSLRNSRRLIIVLFHSCNSVGCSEEFQVPSDVCSQHTMSTRR